MADELDIRIVTNVGEMLPDSLTDDQVGTIVHLGKTMWGIMTQLEEMNRAGAGNVAPMAATGLITLGDTAGDIAGRWTITVDRAH